MKALIASLGIFLSASLAAQNAAPKFMDFYAGMPLEEFQAASELHGAVYLDQGRSTGVDRSNNAFFVQCEETQQDVANVTAEEPQTPQNQEDWYSCAKFGPGDSSLTVAGFPVYRASLWPYEAPLFNATLLFTLYRADLEHLLVRLSQRFGEPDHVRREEDVLKYAQWQLNADGDFNTIVDISKVTTERGPIVILGTAKNNPTARQQWRETRELSAGDGF